jgi:hypothetical protein
VDGVNVTWGIYAGGVAFDTSGNAIAIDFHPFAFTNGGATPSAVISNIGGTAAFSTVVGSSTVTESGKLISNSGVTLNVGVNLTAATVTNYALAVTDGNNRNWTGNLINGTPVALSTFANGTPLAVTCNCSGTTSGSAAGILIGQNAGGMISSFVLKAGQAAVAGAVVIK